MAKGKDKLTEKLLKQYKQEAIDYIREAYFLFKVCECCDSIVTYDCAVCIVCRNYRFDDTRKRVIEQALLAEKDDSIILF